MLSAVHELFVASIDNAGRWVTVASLPVGALAGLVLFDAIQVPEAVWAAITLRLVAGGLVAFLVDLFLISPIRLWRRALKENARLRDQLANQGTAPLTAIPIERAGTVNIHNYYGPWSGPSVAATTDAPTLRAVDNREHPAPVPPPDATGDAS